MTKLNFWGLKLKCVRWKIHHRRLTVRWDIAEKEVNGFEGILAQLVKIGLQCRRLWFNSWVGKIHWRRDRLPTPVFLDFPCGSAGKDSSCNAGDPGSISGLGRLPGEGKGYPLQYSGLENSMDYRVLGVAKSHTQLSYFHFHYRNSPKGNIQKKWKC